MSNRKTDTKMTDPVDTDALRGRADENGEWAQVAFGLPNRDEDARELLLNADMFRTAADEVDRLRADLGTQERVNADIKLAADAFLEESEHLRAVIENAPHGANCNCSTYRFEGVVQTVGCTCWKAGAL